MVIPWTVSVIKHSLLAVKLAARRNTAAEHSRQLSSQSLEEAQIDIEGH